MTDKHEIAKWLHSEILENGARRSTQSSLVRKIRSIFGEEWSYKNPNGNWAINRGVLTEFRKLKDEHVYWDSSDQSWRVVTPDQLAYINERAAFRKERREENARQKAEWEASR